MKEGKIMKIRKGTNNSMKSKLSKKQYILGIFSIFFFSSLAWIKHDS